MRTGQEQYEIEYARRWRGLAKTEGHRSKLPRRLCQNSLRGARAGGGQNPHGKNAATINHANIVAVLTPNKQRISEIAKKVGVRKETAAKHIHAMVTAGIAKRDGKGVWLA